MNILILNGSPHPDGNTAAMVAAFAKGAEEKGHQITAIDVCTKNIAGCLGCEHCHTTGNGECAQKDDMQKVYTALKQAEMIVVASPIYYFGFSGQMQCAINRMYACGKPKNVKKAMLILSSGSDDVYDGAVYEYEKTFVEYMGLKSAGIFKAFGRQNKSEEVLSQLNRAGQSL